jgi:lysophospholipase L1-like esterase
MILFLGDSFTWGQGLPIEIWLKEGKSLDYCNRLPPKVPSELYNYEDDNYRKQNHFPNLVAKHFNKSYVTKFGNGGTNQDIVDIIRNIGSHCDGNGVDFYLIQFTEVSRDPNLHNRAGNEFEDTVLKEGVEAFFQSYIKEQIKTIDNIISKSYNKKWFGFSWRDDFGKILEENYPKNYIPIDYNNKLYNNFEELRNENKHLMLSGKYKGIDDSHLNSDGHKVLANSIINKINLYL